MEPEHSIRREAINQSWDDDTRKQRYNGWSVDALTRHFASLTRAAEKELQRQRDGKRRRRAKAAQENV